MPRGGDGSSTGCALALGHDGLHADEDDRAFRLTSSRRDRRSARGVVTPARADDLAAARALIETATNRVEWYQTNRTRKRAPQSAVDALDLALAIYAALAGPPHTASVDGAAMLARLAARRPWVRP